MKILVTGNAGFVGMNLALRLQGSGYDVIGLDNLNSYYDIDLKYARLIQQGIDVTKISYGTLIGGSKPIKFIKLNLEDKENILKLFEEQKFDFVVNLAAQVGVRYSLQNPDIYAESNLIGFLNILEACRRNPVKHFIFASSSSVYGLNATIPYKESESTEHPVSLYAATKKANEMMAHSYAHLYNIPTSGLRFFTVYGPWGRPDMAYSTFAKNIIDGKPIQVFNEGKMKRDFTYIDDITEVIKRLLPLPPVANSQSILRTDTSTAPYSIYNIGNNTSVELLDFIRTIETKLNKKAILDLKPMQPGDVLNTFADTDKLSEVTGYRPATPIEMGIGRFIDWYLQYYTVK